MSEWGLAPEYVLNNWTDDQLLLYIMKRNQRLMRESDSQERPQQRDPGIDYEKAALERYTAWKAACNQ